MRRRGLSLLLTVLAASAACSTTSVSKNARNAPLSFEKTLVVVLDPYQEDGARAACERALADRLAILHPVISSELAGAEEGADRADLVRWASESGADGLVVLDLDSWSTKTFPSIASTYYYVTEDTAGVADVAGVPASEQKTANARLDVISVGDGRVIWSTRITRLDDYPPAAEARSVAKTVVARLAHDRLLP